jgi:hypothetical protein
MTEEVMDINQLNDRIADLKEKIRFISKDIMGVLKEDLPKFVVRELKRMFLTLPDFSKTLNDKQLKGLKADGQAIGEQKTAEILQALEDQEIWLSGKELPTLGKTLTDNAKLWQVVNRISDAVDELLAKYGFPKQGDSYGISYKSPTWFISGKYMPALAEAYWKRIADLREDEELISKITMEKDQEELKKRWDTV